MSEYFYVFLCILTLKLTFQTNTLLNVKKCMCWCLSVIQLLGTDVLYWGVKRPGRHVDHSPPSSVKVKNEWSDTSAPPICFHGVDRDNFNAIILIRIVGLWTEFRTQDRL